jgi:hypothetical protein
VQAKHMAGSRSRLGVKRCGVCKPLLEWTRLEERERQADKAQHFACHLETQDAS